MKMRFRQRLLFALRAAVPVTATVLSGLYALLVTGDTGETTVIGVLFSVLTLALWAGYLFLAKKKKRRQEAWLLTVFWGIGIGAYLVLFFAGSGGIGAMVLSLPVLSLSSLAELFSVQKAGAKLILNLIPGGALSGAGIAALCRLSTSRRRNPARGRNRRHRRPSGRCAD